MFLKDYHNTGSASTNQLFNSDRWNSMVFTTTSAYTISSVKLVLTKVSGQSPGTITVSIRDVDGGTNKPTGSDKTSGTINGNNLPASGTAFQEITFSSPIALTSGTQYAICVRAQNGSGSTYYAAIRRATEAYAGGHKSYSWDTGSTWYNTLSADYFFETYSKIIISDIVTIKRLLVAGNSAIYYEDIGVAAGDMTELNTDGYAVDTTDQLNIFSGLQKAFVVNGAILGVADFVNTKLTIAALTTAPTRGAIVTQALSTATMIVDFVNTTKTEIYGYVTSGTFVTTANNTLSGGSMDPVDKVPSDVDSAPNWYEWTVYPGNNGTMPAKAYIGCFYSGRCVIAGNPEAPNQWYMSRQANPWDWDYTENDAQSPIAGNAADAAESGDIIRALIPFNDDYLVIGCANSMWLLRGDPAGGGRMDELDDTVGIFGAQSWCIDDKKNLYFLGNDGIYKISTGFGSTDNISRLVLPKLIDDWGLDPTKHRVTMVFDSERAGILVCKTTLADGSNENYWYSLITEGFFPESYPTTCGVYSALFYSANDDSFRTLLLGCRDGFLKQFDEAAKNDASASSTSAISSYVLFPTQLLNDEEDKEGRLTSLTFTSAGGTSSSTFGNSDEYNYELHVADDAETVVENVKDGATANESGEVATGGGRKDRIRKRVRGRWLGLYLYNSTASKTWAVESITGVVKPAGRIK